MTYLWWCTLSVVLSICSSVPPLLSDLVVPLYISGKLLRHFHVSPTPVFLHITCSDRPPFVCPPAPPPSPILSRRACDSNGLRQDSGRRRRVPAAGEALRGGPPGEALSRSFSGRVSAAGLVDRRKGRWPPSSPLMRHVCVSRCTILFLGSSGWTPLFSLHPISTRTVSQAARPLCSKAPVLFERTNKWRGEWWGFKNFLVNCPCSRSSLVCLLFAVSRPEGLRPSVHPRVRAPLGGGRISAHARARGAARAACQPRQPPHVVWIVRSTSKPQRRLVCHHRTPRPGLSSSRSPPPPSSRGKVRHPAARKMKARRPPDRGRNPPPLPQEQPGLQLPEVGTGAEKTGAHKDGGEHALLVC